jgi:hypothetical protein
MKASTARTIHRNLDVGTVLARFEGSRQAAARVLRPLTAHNQHRARFGNNIAVDADFSAYNNDYSATK